MYIQDESGNKIELLLSPSGDTYPIGMMAFTAGDKAPTNWLRCDGQEISRTNYAELFDAIGTTYGTGDGSTTFNLPNVNLEHRTLVGSSGDGEFSVGNKMGEEKHTLAKNELPNGVIVNAAGNIHVTTSGNNTVQTLNTGNQPFNIMQPSMASVCCIKAKQSAGIIGDVTNNINDLNENAVPNAKTVKDYVDGTMLYDNETGSNINITLNDTTENYDVIEIFGYRSLGTYKVPFYEKIYKPLNDLRIGLVASNFHSTSVPVSVGVYTITINGNIITKENQITYNIGNNADLTITNADTNSMYITKVIGYKKVVE